VPPDDDAAVGRGYLEHLTRADVVVLAGLGRESPRAETLMSQPERLAPLLAAPAAFDAVFPTSAGSEPLARVSPFLLFALAVHRIAWDVGHAVSVDEWVGPRRRLPVLGAGQLAEFLANGWRRLFLSELLASYTHLAGGTTWVRTSRGWRRRRFSELDPVQLASVIGAVPEVERPGVYRRMGDLALFLTGVFPDSGTTRQFPSIAQARLLRSGGVTDEDFPPLEGVAGFGTVGLLEFLGQRWYRLACSTAVGPPTASLEVVADIADRFSQARRTLNLLADRYLFPLRGYWSDSPGG